MKHGPNTDYENDVNFPCFIGVQSVAKSWFTSQGKVHLLRGGTRMSPTDGVAIPRMKDDISKPGLLGSSYPCPVDPTGGLVMWASSLFWLYDQGKKIKWQKDEAWEIGPR